MLRSTLLLPALLLGSGCSIAGVTMSSGYVFDYRGQVAERTESGALDATPMRFQVDHMFGEVDVAAVEPGETTGWAWTVQTWANDPEVARRFADEVRLHVEETPHGRNFTLDLPDSPGRALRGVRSFLTLRVDPGSDLALSNRHASSRVHGLAGEVRLETAHGDSHVTSLPNGYDGHHRHGNLEAGDLGSSRIETAHGDVRLTDLHGELTARSEHGDLVAHAVRGACDIELDHGDMNLEGLNGARVRGDHGTWRLELDSGDLDLDHAHGDVLVRMGRGQVRGEVEHGDLALHAVHLTGSIEVGHGDLQLDLSEPGALVIGAEASYGDVEGSLPTIRNASADTAQLRLSATHGDIRVD